MDRQPNTITTDDLIIWHFQYRGYEQFKHKIILGGAAYERNQRLPQSAGYTWRTFLETEKRGELPAYYQQHTFSLEELEHQLVTGDLIQDLRFRDYMRSLDIGRNNR